MSNQVKLFVTSAVFESVFAACSVGILHVIVLLSIV